MRMNFWIVLLVLAWASALTTDAWFKHQAVLRSRSAVANSRFRSSIKPDYVPAFPTPDIVDPVMGDYTDHAVLKGERRIAAWDSSAPIVGASGGGNVFSTIVGTSGTVTFTGNTFYCSYANSPSMYVVKYAIQSGAPYP